MYHVSHITYNTIDPHYEHMKYAWVMHQKVTLVKLPVNCQLQCDIVWHQSDLVHSMRNMIFELGTLDFSTETDMVTVQVMATADPESVAVTFRIDGVVQEADESLALKLVPTPSTLRTIPTGEAVFFRSIIEVTVAGVDCKSKNIIPNQS